MSSLLKLSAQLQSCRYLFWNTKIGSGILAQATVRLVSKKTYQWPELKEEDIEEEFMRGGGPGGQAVAKTNNCVQLKHKPTGIVIKSHETRSQSENRRIAREKLIYQLDILYNKENSFEAIIKKERVQKEKVANNKAKKKQELKKQFKEREGIE